MRSCRLLSALLLAGAVIASPAMAARHHHHAARVAVNSLQTCNPGAPAANNAAGCANQASSNMNCAAGNSANCANQANNNPGSNPNLASADSLLQQSSATMNQLQSDNKAANLLRSAKGVFIIPGSAPANTSAGAPQAGGVLMTNNNGRWSNPVFFDVGGTSRSNQPAANSGQVALLIMSDRAMKEFRGGTASLNTKRLHIVNFTPGSQQPPPANTDVLVWSGNNNPPNADMLSGISRIRTNTSFDQAIYGTRSMQQIIAGRAPLTNQLAVNLSNQTPVPQASPQVGTNQNPQTTRQPG